MTAPRRTLYSAPWTSILMKPAWPDLILCGEADVTLPLQRWAERRRRRAGTNLEPAFGDDLVERHARHRHRLLAFAARLWCLSNPLHGRLEQRRRVTGHVERHWPGAVGHGSVEDLDVPEAPRRGDDLAVLGLAGFERDDLETQLVTQDRLTRERSAHVEQRETMAGGRLRRQEARRGGALNDLAHVISVARRVERLGFVIKKGPFMSRPTVAVAERTLLPTHHGLQYGRFGRHIEVLGMVSLKFCGRNIRYCL